MARGANKGTARRKRNAKNKVYDSSGSEDEEGEREKDQDQHPVNNYRSNSHRRKRFRSRSPPRNEDDQELESDQQQDAFHLNQYQLQNQASASFFNNRDERLDQILFPVCYEASIIFNHQVARSFEVGAEAQGQVGNRLVEWRGRDAEGTETRVLTDR